ncbi:MAG: hypothetical protein HQL36_03280 [Alphaproteobacteria bacterium]|nr:hypothetical protein [Alphaproteobacteria bacterium]
MSLPIAIPLNAHVDRNAVRDRRGEFRAVLDLVNRTRGHALPDFRETPAILKDFGDEIALPTAIDVAGPLNGLRIVIAAGYLTECIAFLADCRTDAEVHLRGLGADVVHAPLAGRADCAANAIRMRDHLMGLPRDGRKVLVIAMSKGAADTLETLARHPETHARVDGVAALVGCVWGSPLAYCAPNWLKTIEKYLPMPGCARHGGRAVDSLSPHTRARFMADHPMPEGVCFYTLAAAVSERDVSAAIRPAWRALAAIDPLTDGQMLLRDQILPQSDVLGVLDCDHIAAAMPFNRGQGRLARLVCARLLDRNAFPREIVMEALARFVFADLIPGAGQEKPGGSD